MTDDLVPLEPSLEISSATLPPLSHNAAAHYLDGLKSSSRRDMGRQLDRIAGMLVDGLDARTFPWHAIDYAVARAVRNRLAQSMGLANARQALSALRGVLRQAMLLGTMTAEKYHRAVALDPIRGERVSNTRALSKPEVCAVLAACGARPGAVEPIARPSIARDGAIVACLLYGGMRPHDALGVLVDDYERAGVAGAGVIVVRISKHNRGRRVPIGSTACDLVDRWLEIRRRDPAQSAPVSSGSALLSCVDHSGALFARALTKHALYKRVLAIAARAQLTQAVTPRDFRSTCGTALLDLGADLSAAALILGHANVQTTREHYDKSAERRAASAADRLEAWFRV